MWGGGLSGVRNLWNADSGGREREKHWTENKKGEMVICDREFDSDDILATVGAPGEERRVL